MNVRDLKEILKRYQDDTEIRIDGADDGYHEILGIEIVKINGDEDHINIITRNE